MAYADARGKREQPEAPNPINSTPATDTSASGDTSQNQNWDEILKEVNEQDQRRIESLEKVGYYDPDWTPPEAPQENNEPEPAPITPPEPEPEPEPEPQYTVPKEQQLELDQANVWEPHYTFDEETGEATVEEANPIQPSSGWTQEQIDAANNARKRQNNNPAPTPVETVPETNPVDYTTPTETIVTPNLAPIAGQGADITVGNKANTGTTQGDDDESWLGNLLGYGAGTASGESEYTGNPIQREVYDDSGIRFDAPNTPVARDYGNEVTGATTGYYDSSIRDMDFYRGRELMQPLGGGQPPQTSDGWYDRFLPIWNGSGIQESENSFVFDDGARLQTDILREEAEKLADEQGLAVDSWERIDFVDNYVQENKDKTTGTYEDYYGEPVVSKEESAPWSEDQQRAYDLAGEYKTAGDVWNEQTHEYNEKVDTLVLDKLKGQGYWQPWDAPEDVWQKATDEAIKELSDQGIVKPEEGKPEYEEEAKDYNQDLLTRWNEEREVGARTAEELANPVNQYYTTDELYAEAEQAARDAGYVEGTGNFDRFVDNYVSDARNTAVNNYVQEETERRVQDEYMDRLIEEELKTIRLGAGMDNVSDEEFQQKWQQYWDKMTDSQKEQMRRYAEQRVMDRLNPLARATDQEGNLHFNYVLAREGELPDELTIPVRNADGTMNPAMQEMTSVDYFDENGMALIKNQNGTFSYPDGTPYKGKDIGWKNHYSPEDIMALYVNPNGGHNGEPTWRGMDWINDLSAEEQAGMRQILANFVYGASPDHVGDFGIEMSDLTEEEFERLADMFVKNTPGIEFLLKNGYFGDVELNADGSVRGGQGVKNLVNFFFKDLPEGRNPKGNGNKNGGGYGSSRYRSYGGGGRGGGYRGGGGGSSSYMPNYTNPYSQRSSSGGGYTRGGGISSSSGGADISRSAEPTQTNQRQNRVYNIMKNWSF